MPAPMQALFQKCFPDKVLVAEFIDEKTKKLEEQILLKREKENRAKDGKAKKK